MILTVIVTEHNTGHLNVHSSRLVNSRPICSVLCWPYSSWALNGCHEHGTDNDNGIRERKWETGRLFSPLQTYARFFGFFCVCVSMDE